MSKKSSIRPDLTEAEVQEIREAFNLCVLFALTFGVKERGTDSCLV